RQAGGQERRLGRQLAQGSRQAAAGATDRVDHGARGPAHPGDGGQPAEAARRRGHDRGRRKLEVDGRQASLQAAQSQRDRIRRRGRLRRCLGAGGRLLHDGRRPPQGSQGPGADPRRARTCDQRAEHGRDRRARLAGVWTLRWRALLGDGPQRRGVLAYAGLRRGLRRVRQVRVRARQREDRPPVGPGLGRALMAVRARSPRVRGRRKRPGRDRGLHRGLGRGALDDRGRHRAGRPHAGHHCFVVRALSLTRERRLRRPRARGASQSVRRPRGQERAEQGRARPHARGGESRIPTRRALSVAVLAGHPTGEPMPENPLTAGLERLPVAPTTLVIFGATGDLARRKLLPALYNLAHEGALPERFHLVGVSRKEKENEDYREECEQAIRRFSRRPPDEDVLGSLLENVKYVPGTFHEDSVYSELRQALDDFERQDGAPLNRAFYLSTAPAFFPVIVEQLGKSELAQHENGEVRVIIEKPFGTTLGEARELNRHVLAIFDETPIFRIDHYLGKETVQNMMAFRFANGMFEPLWNRNYIDSVQITAAEDLGIGSRADYYDSSGALRDLIQNHMLQLLCHVAMEPPVSFTAEEVRNEKVKVLQAIPQPTEAEIPEMAVHAQYGPGHAGGDDVPGYLEEEGVPESSNTETFAALRPEVGNWRWAGVPFYLRTGKRLARKITEIAVTLKPVPHLAFSQDGSLGVQ